MEGHRGADIAQEGLFGQYTTPLLWARHPKFSFFSFTRGCCVPQKKRKKGGTKHSLVSPRSAQVTHFAGTTAIDPPTISVSILKSLICMGLASATSQPWQAASTEKHNNFSNVQNQFCVPACDAGEGVDVITSKPYKRSPFQAVL